MNLVTFISVFFYFLVFLGYADDKKGFSPDLNFVVSCKMIFFIDWTLKNFYNFKF